ncbi:MAG: SpoVG family protein [Planctomycetaceae bacterium]
MEITEVRIKLMQEPGDRLQAFCSITLDGVFVVRDLKIINGTRGPFVAMPSRKLNDRCGRCGNKNELRANYCNNCGSKLNEERALRDQSGRAKLYADIAHPINSECREMIQQEVLTAFQLELVKAAEPNYTCTYDDYGESEIAEVIEGASIADAVSPSPTDNGQPMEPIVQTPSPAPVSLPPEPDTEHRIDAAEETPSPHAPDQAVVRVERLEDSFGAGIE